MESKIILTKLIEIEDIIGVEDNAAIRRKVHKAQNCLMRMLEEEEKDRRQPRTISCPQSFNPVLDPMRLGWRRFVEAYAPEFAAAASDGSESHNFSGGWGAPSR